MSTPEQQIRVNEERDGRLRDYIIGFSAYARQNDVSNVLRERDRALAEVASLREQVAALEDRLRTAERNAPPTQQMRTNASANPSWIPIQTDRPCVCGHDASVHEFFAPTGPCLDCECWAYRPAAAIRAGIACPTGEHRLGTVCTHPTEGATDA